MLKHGKQILSISLVLLITIGLAIPAFGMEKPTIGLLKINNYSGVDTVGGNKLERLVVEEFVANIQKQGSVQFISHEKVKEFMSKKNLDCYYEAADLCTVADLYSIGSELGMAQLLVLDINGYSEVKREKSKKSYQLLLGLYVVDCTKYTETNYTGEGFSDGSRQTAFTNTISQLINNYLSLETADSDPSSGNMRPATVQVAGNKTSKMYHLLNTNHAPSETNCESFDSRIKAEAEQYRPCPICFPSYKSFSYKTFRPCIVVRDERLKNKKSKPTQ